MGGQWGRRRGGRHPLVWHKEQNGRFWVLAGVLAGAQHPRDDEFGGVLLIPSLVEAWALWSLGHWVDVHAERLRWLRGATAAEVFMRGGTTRDGGASPKERQHGDEEPS